MWIVIGVPILLSLALVPAFVRDEHAVDEHVLAVA
jgi:hypothetical protein